MSLESKESKADHLKQMLNRYAKTQGALKRGDFEVTAGEGRLIIQWSNDQRSEQFLVKEPNTPQELQGTVTDVFYRLKKRIASPAELATPESPTPAKK